MSLPEWADDLDALRAKDPMCTDRTSTMSRRIVKQLSTELLEYKTELLFTSST